MSVQHTLHTSESRKSYKIENVLHLRTEVVYVKNPNYSQLLAPEQHPVAIVYALLVGAKRILQLVLKYAQTDHILERDRLCTAWENHYEQTMY